jgi:predicted MPP superfamily phosphohydrolase
LAATLPLAAVAAATAGIGYAWMEARAFSLRRVTVPVLPPGTASLRVLHLSDLHMVPRQRRKLAWVQRLDALDPDLVVSTGDSLADMDAVDTALEAHGALLRRPGVFVLGSNDYFAPRLKNPARYLFRNGGSRRILGHRLPTDDLVKGFLDAGWTDLTNRRTALDAAGTRLEFVGVDDPHLQLDRYEDVAGAADPDAALTIGITHAPYRRVLDAMTADGAGLVLAGHTHGGQLCLPMIEALVTNCDLPRYQARGVSRWPSQGRRSWRASAARAAEVARASDGDSRDAAWLHVSAGLGTPPSVALRFACRPEATLLTLVARGSR